MWNAVKELLSSKKFVTAVVSVAATAAARFGYDVPTGEIVTFVMPLWVYILGQGLADVGKERAKLERGN